MIMVSFGIEFLANEPAQKLAELVAFSEENGLEYAWITDHYNNRDSFSLLTYIAARTKTIKLGTGVTNPYTRSVVQLASAIATVNEVSEGRAVLGIGPGDKMTFDSLGIEWEKPLETIRETVDVIRQMQTGKKISYDGNILKIKSAKLNFGKGSTIPPVYIGAQGPNMLKLAGEIGDGALVNASHPDDFKFAVKLLKEGRCGRDFSKFDVGAYTSFSVASKKEDAQKAAKPVTAFIVAGSPDSVLKKHGLSDNDVQKLRDAFKVSFADAVRAVTPEMMDAFAICGTPDDCIEKISGLIKVGVTQVVVGSPIGPDRTEAIKLVGKEIIPNFK